MVTLASLAWVSNLLEIVGSMLPFGAFGVTNDWVKSFDCFGATALLTDHAVFAMKALLYLFMTGLNPNACPLIADALAVCCFCTSSSACALLFLISVKSAHGVRHEVVRWIWLVLLVLVGFMGGILYLIQEPRQVHHHAVLWVSLPISFAQFVQAWYPLHKRSCDIHRGNFVDDESMVLAIKTVATAITMLTSLYDAWSYWNSLKKYVDREALASHRAMCVLGCISALVQTITRILSAKHRFEAVFTRVKVGWATFTSGVSSKWESLISCLDDAIVCVKSFVHGIGSGCAYAVDWVKHRFTGGGLPQGASLGGVV